MAYLYFYIHLKSSFRFTRHHTTHNVFDEGEFLILHLLNSNIMDPAGLKIRIFANLDPSDSVNILTLEFWKGLK